MPIARGVQLVHHADVDRIRFEKKQARGRLVADRTRSRHPRDVGRIRIERVPPDRIAIAARLIVVAAGAIETPALLPRAASSRSARAIGRGLVTHPSLPVIGVMDHEISTIAASPARSTAIAYATRTAFYFETLFGHPVYGSVVIPGFGPSTSTSFASYRA